MIVAVVGKGRDCVRDTWAVAVEVGMRVAAAGHVVVTGGLAGVMDGAARGAQRAGGVVIGLLPAGREDEATDQLTYALPTGLTEPVRNIVIGSCCDAMLACFGSHGTLQELAVAIDRGIPVAAVETERWAGLGIARLLLTEVDEWLSSIG